MPNNKPMIAKPMNSMVPHPTAVGSMMAKNRNMGIAPRHLAGGGIANAENISNNIFDPINAEGGIPNADVNFITSPQLGIGKGPPAAQAAKPQQQENPMQQIAQTGAGVNNLMNAGNGIGTLWNGSTMSAADAAAYNSENGLAAGDADFASAGDTIGGLGDWFSSLFAAAPEVAAAAAVGAAKGGSIPGYASGGDIPGLDSLTNMLMRKESGETFHPSGLLNSAGPGRTDTINTNVPAGAYVIPADVVSGLGEGNTLAGSAVIDRIFSTAPHGIKAPQIKEGRGEKIPNPPSSAYANNYLEPQGVDQAFIDNEGKFAKGGAPTGKAPVIVAGGEHVVSPEQIIAKFGSLKRGHKILDEWIVHERQKIAKEMLKLPNPVGSRVKK